MKFFVRNLTKTGPRIGFLTEMKRKPNVSVQTPMVMLHTQGGQVPHITHEVLRLFNNNPQILQIPLVSVYNFKDAIDDFDGSISEFIGNKENVCCMTLQDPSNLTHQGHHVKGKIPIWTKNGKAYYDSKTYMDTVLSFLPEMYHLLSDGDTNQSSPQKRLTKAVDNTILFHSECLAIHRGYEKLKTSLIIAPIAGGYSLPHRKKCLDSILQDDEEIGGYLIDGLHNNGPEVELISFRDIQPVIEFIINNLPPQKLRAVQGCWNPLVVIRLVQLGVDMFDTSYCKILTERSAAITFPIDDSHGSSSWEINLRQPRYIDDFQPILEGCKCTTCLKYSRGYIHHLLSVQELLGPVLIMIHNIHHYLKFIEKIRECISEKSLDEFEVNMENHFRRYQQDTILSQEEPDTRDSVS